MKFVVLADSDIVPLVLGICKKFLAKRFVMRLNVRFKVKNPNIK